MKEQSQLDPFTQKIKVRWKRKWTLQMDPRKRRYEEKRLRGIAQEEGQYAAASGNTESGPMRVLTSDPQMLPMNPRKAWPSKGCWKPSRTCSSAIAMQEPE